MSLDAVELIRQRIIPLFKSEFDLLENEAQEGTCCFLGLQGKVYKVDGLVPSLQCDVVRLFTLGSLNLIGHNIKETSPMRFMDYSQAYMLIPTNKDQPEFWCSGKFFPKIAKNSPFINRQLGGGAAEVALLDDAREMLVIDISKRKEFWLKNLMVGTEDFLIICNELQTNIIPRKNWTKFKEAFVQLDKKTRNQALIVLRGLNFGSFETSNEKCQAFFKKNLAFALLCKECLPIQPSARKFWLSALGNLK